MTRFPQACLGRSHGIRRNMDGAPVLLNRQIVQPFYGLSLR
jgi:hypothetical protein